MSTLHRPLWALAALALLPSACAHQTPTPSSQPKDIDWDVQEFYRPPSPLPSQTPGYVIEHEPLEGPAALEEGINERVLYVSNSGGPGEPPIAVSGIIALPKTPPIDGGWPVVTWAHGTLGIADQCAPSRDVLGASAHWFNQAPHRLLNQFLKKGWAVVMTDYEGLGTPGRHPYMLGKSQAYGVLDIVRAAHALHGAKLSKKFAITGHSQGGQGALFAAAQAPHRLKVEEGLELKGVIAYAPASAMLPLFYAATAIPNKTPDSAFMPLFLTGAVAGNPTDVVLGNILQADTLALYNRDIDTRCRIELSQEDSWGGLVPLGHVLKLVPATAGLNVQLAAMDPSTLTLEVPVRLVQGAQDTRVSPVQTWRVKGELEGKGARVDYFGCPVADHFGVLGDDIPGSLDWLEQQFTGAPGGTVMSSCQRLLTEPPDQTP
ncbi:alpha/beta hydrolase family protein [Corallococcus carmarthensis]|uniref:Alpha/beta fold hydrolase n=1 Tax=Corallococcus carmarthensis TaxID=2316728 RepID=A0A3A8KPC3_9BACT|nr:alpha/beta fold hydrolase [Corallococcus carmarthensis]NOK21849.1 alpha/beta fold hydrolase [Corallococcus carmarthensis]RKH03804.1 alpha/beta fold hydrolase [Corallococcus carmarthensis]